MDSQLKDEGKREGMEMMTFIDKSDFD